jgi:holo-[acyl-carrier protein] synthase
VNGVALAAVSIERIDALRRRYGERFARRWFTESERTFCEQRRLAGQHYAARLAAKLAVLRLTGPMSLRAIEVRRDDAGAPFLAVDTSAARRPVHGRLHVSLSHDGGLAVALVVGDDE